MVLIQLLLPTTFPNEAASQDATAALADTRRELGETLCSLHHFENATDVMVRYANVKQVRHAVHENDSRPLPVQRDF